VIATSRLLICANEKVLETIAIDVTSCREFRTGVISGRLTDQLRIRRGKIDFASDRTIDQIHRPSIIAAAIVGPHQHIIEAISINVSRIGYGTASIVRHCLANHLRSGCRKAGSPSDGSRYQVCSAYSAVGGIVGVCSNEEVIEAIAIDISRSRDREPRSVIFILSQQSCI
jgi:hypothetical protein